MVEVLLTVSLCLSSSLRSEQNGKKISTRVPSLALGCLTMKMKCSGLRCRNEKGKGWFRGFECRSWLSVELVVNFDWLNGAVLKLLSEELLVQRRN